MTIHFSIEPYAQLIDEIKPLLFEHWRELAVYQDIPLDPDYDFYEKANSSGMLTYYVAREGRALIGYAIFVVKPGGHPHYRRHGWAMNDIVWIRPDRRNLGVGRQFAKYWESDLNDRGVHVVHVNAKTGHPELAMLLLNCGYAKIEEGYEKRLR